MLIGGINKIPGRKYTMSEVARILDCGLGRNKLHTFLKEKQIINEHKMPAQKYLDSGLMAYENKLSNVLPMVTITGRFISAWRASNGSVSS